MNFYKNALNNIGPVLLFSVVYIAFIKAFTSSCESLNISKIYGTVFIIISLAHSAGILTLMVKSKVDGEGILNMYVASMFVFSFVFFGLYIGSFGKTVLISSIGVPLMFFQFMTIYGMAILVSECFFTKYSEAYNS